MPELSTIYRSTELAIVVLGDAGAHFFCTGHDVLEILPPPQSALRPKRVTLWATQGFAPTGGGGS
jgi:hypothetical protein